ncbi:protein of unknown function [Burkholderia multivorans]
MSQRFINFLGRLLNTRGGEL